MMERWNVIDLTICDTGHVGRGFLLLYYLYIREWLLSSTVDTIHGLS